MGTPYLYAAPGPATRTVPTGLTFERLSYLKTALEVFVLLLALPWIIRELWHDPIDAGRKIAGAHKPLSN